MAFVFKSQMQSPSLAEDFFISKTGQFGFLHGYFTTIRAPILPEISADLLEEYWAPGPVLWSILESKSFP